MAKITAAQQKAMAAAMAAEGTTPVAQPARAAGVRTRVAGAPPVAPARKPAALGGAGRAKLAVKPAAPPEELAKKTPLSPVLRLKKLGKVMPKKLAEVADAMYAVKQRRLAMAKDLEKLEEEEAAYKAHLIAELPKGAAKGVTGKVANATITESVKPLVEDWGKLYKHIIKENAFDMLQKRLSEAAISARWEEGQAVPGVGKLNVKGISLTKA